MSNDCPELNDTQNYSKDNLRQSEPEVVVGEGVSLLDPLCEGAGGKTSHSIKGEVTSFTFFFLFKSSNF